MFKINQEDGAIILQGWLTKSPPTKRIWRAKWRRRWFALRQSGELPGQYFLDYYSDRNCRRLKGTIDLDQCEQVDAGLHMERSGAVLASNKLRGSVFSVRTQARTFHLEAETEVDMEKWVDAICKVCGLRATDDSVNNLENSQNNLSGLSATNEQYEYPDTTGPYIPISECITGSRIQNPERAFTFDPKNIVTSNPSRCIDNNKSYQTSNYQGFLKPNNDYSENESNLSDEDCKSLNTSSNIDKQRCILTSNEDVAVDWSVAKSFTKLSMDSKNNGVSPSHGPPIPPPRPPKTLTMNKNITHKDPFHGPKIQEPSEKTIPIVIKDNSLSPWLRVSGRRCYSNASSLPARAGAQATLRYTDDEEDCFHPNHPLMQYSNLPSLPPAVDRALKPRLSSHSVGHINHLFNASPNNLMHLGSRRRQGMKADALQYLDLDLHSSKSVPPKVEAARYKPEVSHGKSLSSVESDSAYKTVDFLKTEAFNITRKDAEASRSIAQYSGHAVG